MRFESKLLKEYEVKRPISEFDPGQAFLWKTFSQDEIAVCVFVDRNKDGMNTFLCLNNMKIYGNYETDTQYTLVNIKYLDVEYANVREGEV